MTYYSVCRLNERDQFATVIVDKIADREEAAMMAWMLQHAERFRVVPRPVFVVKTDE